MSENSLKILLLSDLHAFSANADQKAQPHLQPSYLELGTISSEPYLNPFEGLSRLISERDMKADVVVCAGDMGDKGSDVGIPFVWDNLQKLGQKVEAKHVIATAGNHDIDSRYKTDNSDPLKLLKALSPKFPGLTKGLCDSFWANAFAVLTQNDWRIVLLNSCAYHGSGKDPQKEFECGHVKENTIRELRSALEHEKAKRLNLLVCHHHPIRHNAIQGDDYSEMLGGDQLIYELDRAELGPWVVLHGHRHFPRVIYGQGSSSSPIVFSAGSFSARLYPELGARVRNQVYLLEFPIDEFEPKNLDVAARVLAWDWIPHTGWQKAGTASGLPGAFGFGRRVSFVADSNEIFQKLSSQKGRYLTRSEFLIAMPWLEYVVPVDLERLLERLRARGVHTTFNSEGVLDQMGVL